MAFPSDETAGGTGPNRPLWIGLALAVVTAVAYLPVLGNGFVLLDDPGYLTGNGRVQEGITRDSARWAFTTFELSNWHPLTWLSHMLDVELFGLDPAGHHAVNLLLHAVNGVFLFSILRRMTGATWRSALVAALFALHPLHVESVAWVSERKDVLSTFFLFATIGAYARYAESRSVRSYLAALACFALGLLAKPMLVTTPFLLLLLDCWPLGGREGGLPHLREMPALRPASVARAVFEKIPFLLLSAASSVMTMYAQSGARSASALVFPLDERLRNAAVAVARYVGKAAIPSSLAVLYPHDVPPVAAWKVAGAVAAIAAVSFAALRCRRRWPFLPVGWFWFLGTLVPVIGLVQVGEQSMADRYTYIPLIGLFLAVVWGGAELAGRLRIPPKALAAAACAWLLVLAGLTWRQAGFWRDSVTLARHAVAVTGNAARMRQMLGMACRERGAELIALGRYPEAIDLLAESDRNTPYDPVTNYQLGVALARSGRLAEARPWFEKAVDISPGWGQARFSLGLLYEKLGERKLADGQYGEALRIDPANAAARARLAK